MVSSPTGRLAGPRDETKVDGLCTRLMRSRHQGCKGDRVEALRFLWRFRISLSYSVLCEKIPHNQQFSGISSSEQSVR
jgi:hypothetical protein